MDKTIKIIGVAILSLVMASCAGKQSKSQEGAGEDLVEITPSFTEAVHQFDELYPFSEGLAAVKKNGKFGFIDTKGELIIPCQFSYACAFFEGLSIVMDDEYNISILLRNGEIKHTPYKLDTSYYGLGGWHGDKGYYMFRFQNKKCAIKTENSPEEVIIDENGKECVNVSDVNFTTNDFYSSSDTICHNPTLLKYSSEKQNIFGNKETYYGIKDSSNSIIASAKYTYIGEYSNGVALCIIFVGNAETKGIPYGIHLPDGEYFFGYIDKKGNTTFTEADMEKIEGYKEAQTSALTNLMQQEEEQAQLEEEQRIQEELQQHPEIEFNEMLADNAWHAYGTWGKTPMEYIVTFRPNNKYAGKATFVRWVNDGRRNEYSERGTSDSYKYIIKGNILEMEWDSYWDGLQKYQFAIEYSNGEIILVDTKFSNGKYRPISKTRELVPSKYQL